MTVDIKQILHQVFPRMCVTYFWKGENIDYGTEKYLNLQIFVDFC